MRNMLSGTKGLPVPLPNYLCFTANTAWSTIKLNKNGSPTEVALEASNDWRTWTIYTFWDTITLTNVWDKVYWRNSSTIDTWLNIDNNNYYRFDITWSVAWSWDINYLLNKNSTTTLSRNCFTYLFAWNHTSLTAAPELPSTSLVYGCYSHMFYYCQSLISAPELPATTLAEYCYTAMFRNCEGLTTAPVLPATTLAGNCYREMFYSCESLISPPALPATTLNSLCYDEMFVGCHNLTALPALPATTLAHMCYYYMFYWCSKIKLSETQTWEYTNVYRIPTTWTWTTTSYALDSTFESTWWTFTGTPTINTTYYTSNTIVS